MENRTVSLDELKQGEDVVFTPSEIDVNPKDRIATIICSLGNRYTVSCSNAAFLEKLKAIYDKMRGHRYSLYCYMGKNGLDCDVM